MDFASILQEIDIEIEKLKRIRAIFLGLAGPARQKKQPKPSRLKQQPTVAASPRPPLVILPPRVKREYRPRLRPTVEMPRALGPAPSNRPVFVPRTIVPAAPARSSEVVAQDAEVLASVMRRNLLGGEPSSSYAGAL
jgi:hypothetical protein